MSDVLVTPPRTADGPLLLADIGGYTSFLRNVQAAHAYDAFADGNIPDAYGLMSSLLDGIVARLVPPFRLSKLEGDAVFVYADNDGVVPRGTALIACIASCHEDFHRRLEAAHDVWSCRCEACMRIDTLELKFILHAGPFVIQEIAGASELVGPEVVMAHRLLKSDAAEVAGTGAYALLTSRAVERFAVAAEGAVPMIANYEHYEPIETLVFPLRA